jgi:hypothetical protein
MTELVLYTAAGVPSPRRVKMCLFEKGLPFKIKWLNLALMDQKQPSYLKLNPTGKEWKRRLRQKGNKPTRVALQRPWTKIGLGRPA